MIVPKLTAEQRKLVDEFREVRARYLAFKPNVNPDAARYAVLEETILGWFAGMKGDEVILAKGDKFSVPISACERKRTIKNIPALLKRLGTAWVKEHFKPTLKDLTKALDEKELAKFVDETRTGPRTVGEPVAAS